MNLLRTGLLAVALFSLVGTGCAKKDESANKKKTKTSKVSKQTKLSPEQIAAAKKKADDEAAAADKKKKNAKRIKDALAKMAEHATSEKARLTADVQKQVVALTSKSFKDTGTALKAIMAAPHRLPGNSDRDVYRHPAETLTFLGIKPTMTVIEVGIGAGWYTELLAPLLMKDGKLLGGSFDPAGPADSMRTVYGQRAKAFVAKLPSAYGKVQLLVVNADSPEFGPAGSADAALAIREMHNWHRGGKLAAYVAAVHKALKPNGIFGVVQHRAAKDGVADDTAKKGYLPQEWLIKQVEAAGFKLEAKSEINANPKDTKDYEKGVWTLPPARRGDAKDKAKYDAIGESDRMTLKFVKK